MVGEGAFLLVVMVIVAILLNKTVPIVPAATEAVIERLGRYKRTEGPGLVFLVPFLDRVRARVDLREQVVTFSRQPVITQDDEVATIDVFVHFQVTDAKAAVYEVSDYVTGLEQITITALRDVVGRMTSEETIASHHRIGHSLRGRLDGEARRWGIRVGRVELKVIDQPSARESIQR